MKRSTLSKAAIGFYFLMSASFGATGSLEERSLHGLDEMISKRISILNQTLSNPTVSNMYNLDGDRSPYNNTFLGLLNTIATGFPGASGYGYEIFKGIGNFPAPRELYYKCAEFIRIFGCKFYDKIPQTIKSIKEGKNSKFIKTILEQVLKDKKSITEDELLLDLIEVFKELESGNPSNSAEFSKNLSHTVPLHLSLLQPETLTKHHALQSIIDSVFAEIVENDYNDITLKSIKEIILDNRLCSAKIARLSFYIAQIRLKRECYNEQYYVNSLKSNMLENLKMIILDYGKDGLFSFSDSEILNIIQKQEVLNFGHLISQADIIAELREHVRLKRPWLEHHIIQENINNPGGIRYTYGASEIVMNTNTNAIISVVKEKYPGTSITPDAAKEKLITELEKYCDRSRIQTNNQKTVFSEIILKLTDTLQKIKDNIGNEYAHLQDVFKEMQKYYKTKRSGINPSTSEENMILSLAKEGRVRTQIKRLGEFAPMLIEAISNPEDTKLKDSYGHILEQLNQAAISNPHGPTGSNYELGDESEHTTDIGQVCQIVLYVCQGMGAYTPSPVTPFVLKATPELKANEIEVATKIANAMTSNKYIQSILKQANPENLLHEKVGINNLSTSPFKENAIYACKGILKWHRENKKEDSDEIYLKLEKPMSDINWCESKKEEVRIAIKEFLKILEKQIKEEVFEIQPYLLINAAINAVGYYLNYFKTDIHDPNYARYDEFRNEIEAFLKINNLIVEKKEHEPDALTTCINHCLLQEVPEVQMNVEAAFKNPKTKDAAVKYVAKFYKDTITDEISCSEVNAKMEEILKHH